MPRRTHKILDLRQGDHADAVRITQTDTGGGDAHRAVFVVGDPESGGGLASLVQRENQWGLVVSDQGAPEARELLFMIEKQQRLTNLILSRLVGETLTVDDLVD